MREVQEGMQQGSAPAKPLLAAWELQDPRATSGGGHRELSPHLRSPRPRRAQLWGHRASTGRLTAWAVPFVYTLEDTQLRKHRRRHAVGNGDVGGTSFGFRGCRVGFYLPPRPPQTGLRGSSARGTYQGCTGVGIWHQLSSRAEGFFFHATACLRMLFMCFSSVNS